MNADQSTTAQETPYWRIPRLHPDDRMALGVAAGIAEEIGVDVIWVRISFVVLFALGGWGALLYGVAWLAFLTAGETASAEQRQPKGFHPAARFVGFTLSVAGLIVALAGLTRFPDNIIWPIAIFGVGLLIAWRKIEHTDRFSRASLVQILVGLGVAAVGVILLVVWNAELGSVDTVVLSLLAALVAALALSAPWWLELIRQLDTERQARARSDERAVVAAHLHDSVLQTLTLIQKNEDPSTMANLARRQERELRNWLDPDRASRSGMSVRGQLDQIATDVEDLHGANVEVVVVGDCLVDEAIEATLGAAREAAVNAAKHSGADHVDIFVEVGSAKLEIFVRDTGTGFDLDQVDEDRQGIRGSIQERMERVGGTAIIHTALGEGTEVELSIPRSNAATQDNQSDTTSPATQEDTP